MGEEVKALIFPTRVGRGWKWQTYDPQTKKPYWLISAGATVKITILPDEGVSLFMRRIAFGGLILPNIFRIEILGNRDIAYQTFFITEEFLTQGVDLTDMMPEIRDDDPLSFLITNTDTVARLYQSTVWFYILKRETADKIREMRAIV